MFAAKLVLSSLLLACPALVNAQLFTRNLDVAAQVHPGGSYLGVSIAEINAEQGVQIVRVSLDTPAAKAGLKAGDIILSYNGEPVLSSQQLGRLVSETPPGRHVKVQFVRDGKTNTATVVTAVQPTPTHSVDFGAPLESWRPDLNPGLADVPVPSICWRNMLLGMEYESLSPQLAPFFGVHEGILVRSVEGGSAVDKAGVKPGDVVVGVGDRAIANRQDLSTCMRQQGTSGKAIQLAVIRDHKRLSLNLQLPE